MPNAVWPPSHRRRINSDNPWPSFTSSTGATSGNLFIASHWLPMNGPYCGLTGNPNEGRTDWPDEIQKERL